MKPEVLNNMISVGASFKEKKRKKISILTWSYRKLKIWQGRKLVRLLKRKQHIALQSGRLFTLHGAKVL